MHYSTDDWYKDKLVNIKDADYVETIAPIYWDKRYNEDADLGRDKDGRTVVFRKYTPESGKSSQEIREYLLIETDDDWIEFLVWAVQKGKLLDIGARRALERCSEAFPNALEKGYETFHEFNSNSNIHHEMEYYYEEALKIVREKFPKTERADLGDDFEIGYWNNEEMFINRHGYVEYPGDWYPSPLNVSEQEMIDIIAQNAIKKLTEG